MLSRKVFERKIIFKIIFLMIIFFIGFFFRIDSTNIHGISLEEKDFFKDDNGKPYMYELDSYYNYRLTKNYLTHGYMGDKFVGDLEWDSYSYSPPGVPMDYPPLIVYLTALTFIIINFFTNAPLLNICFWLPAIIAPLAGIITYLFVMRFSGDFSGLIAGILVNISPLYLLRTVPGWFDTDMFNVIFPLLITWLFMESIYSKNLRKKSLFSFSAAFAMFLFSTAWNGWQYIFYFISLFTFFYLIWLKLNSKKVKNCFLALLIFFIFSLAFIFFFTGYINFIKPFSGLLELTKLIGFQSLWSPWPNLYITISELQIPTFDAFVSDVGVLILFLGILGFLLIFRLMFNQKMLNTFLKTKSKFFYLFILSWLLLGFLSILKGARFIILIIPPLAITAGITVGILLGYIENFNKNKKMSSFLSIIFLLIIILPSFLNAYASLQMLKPGVDDDLWDSALWIRTNTSNDTIIISDWSYGHFLTGIAERPVSFDGRSAYIETVPVRKFYGDNLTFNGKIPNTSREYWIARAFSTDNETLSVGIFTMLANSGDSAYLTLENYTKNTTKSVKILNDILGVDSYSAEMILINKYNFNEKETSEILNYTHYKQNKPFIIFTCDGMIRTGKWDFHFGTWNFENEKGGNYSYSVGNLKINQSEIRSTNNVTGDFERGILRWNDEYPFCVIQVKNGNTKKRYINQKSKFCIVLQYDSQKVVIIDKKFENSLFTNLVLEKSNTSYFKSIYQNKEVTIWKIKK